MKILATVPSYLPGFRYGGPIRSVHGMARALVERGHSVRVITTDCDEGVRLDVPRGRTNTIDGVEVVYAARRGPNRLRFAPQARALFESACAEVDLVWVNGLFQLHSSCALRAAARAGVATVVSPRGMLDRRMLERRGRLRKRLWLAALDRRALLAADAWHLTAESERASLPDLGRPAPPSFVIENGVEHEALGDGLDAVRADVRALLDEPAPTLLFLGRINWKKGLDRLVEALARLPESVRLLVAGPDDGGLATLVRDVQRAGLERRVHRIGPVTGATRAALLEQSDLLVLPSYSENFGNVVLEALAAGTPAVVTPEVGAAAILERSGAGRVASGSPEVLAGLLAELLSDRVGLAAMSARARRVADSYAWPRIAERFEGALLDVLARRASTARRAA